METTKTKYTIELVLAWALVGIPLLWGVIQTGIKASQMFK